MQYIYVNSPFFLSMQNLWTDWPDREMTGLMKGYLLAQWAFWLHEIIVLNIEDRRKDHWQMFSHHITTLFLIAACYSYHFSRVGTLILISMDISDIFLPVSVSKTPRSSSSCVLMLETSLAGQMPQVCRIHHPL